MSNQTAQHEFLIYELGILSLKAALSTRAGDAPIYASTCKEHQRVQVKEDLRLIFGEILTKYANASISEIDHIEFMVNTAQILSEKHAANLHRGRLRIGVAQKLINIHLKYLWVAGFIPEPPHCPIDGIIRNLASLQYDWTTSDSQEKYEQAIEKLKQVAGTQSLSIWELHNFRRRAQHETSAVM